jgi:hypothetical protein
MTTQLEEAENRLREAWGPDGDRMRWRFTSREGYSVSVYSPGFRNGEVVVYISKRIDEKRNAVTMLAFSTEDARDLARAISKAADLAIAEEAVAKAKTYSGKI